jgi:hypothetical protein
MRGDPISIEIARMTALFHAVPISRSGLLKGGTVPVRKFCAEFASSLHDVQKE